MITGLTHMLMIIYRNLSLFSHRDWIDQREVSIIENLDPLKKLLMIIFYRTIGPYNFPLFGAFSKPQVINSTLQIRLKLKAIA